jgi:hypothetical protein
MFRFWLIMPVHFQEPLPNMVLPEIGSFWYCLRSGWHLSPVSVPEASKILFLHLNPRLLLKGIATHPHQA